MPVAKEQIRQIISENNLNSVTDVYALLRNSFKDILQELMEAEPDAAPGYEKNHKGDLQTDNKRNGHSPKNLRSRYGEFQIDVPRDRNGEFEPKLIPKYQRDISGIEEKVISLYARGMSTRDIHDQLNDLYGIELSAEMVSKITDKILPQVREWQSRPLNPVYPFVFMDCIHYKVREDGRILSRAAYVVLGVTAEGYKEILSTTVGANETSKFWSGMLNDLHSRGVKDVLFFCVDGLPGFKEAIQAVFPRAEIPELGPGAEPVDCPVWRTADGIPVKKDRDGSIQKSLPSQPYSIGIYIIARKSRSYSGGRVWAEPAERAIRYNTCLPYKKQKKCISCFLLGIL